MNAFARSAASMASTLASVGQQRAPQDVRVLTTMCGMPFGPKRLVSVGGLYFTVFDRTYQQLLRGIPPGELALEEVGPDEEEA
jgi:hypothetical protein